MDLQKEHFRAYIFLECQRGRKPSEIYQQLQETHVNIPSQPTVFKWCKRFREGRQSLNDDVRGGRPSTSSTPENVQILKGLIEEQPRTSLRDLSETTGLSKDTIRHILTDELGLRKICSTWIPHHLSEANKRDRMLCAQNILDIFQHHPLDHLMHNWATEDESWFLYETAPTKQENMAWCHPAQPHPTVVRSKLTNKKTLLLLAFTGDGKISAEKCAPGETINSERYVAFVRSTGEKWRHVRTNPRKLCDMLWQHDNARPHKSKETQEFFDRRGIPLIKQSAYSPDMNQCDRWVFKYLKHSFRGIRFVDGEEVLSRAVQELRRVSEDKYCKELIALREHCKLVLQNQGNYVI
jgi:transposase